MNAKDKHTKSNQNKSTNPIIFFVFFTYEVILSIIFTIVGYYRNEKSFYRREKYFKPFRHFLNNIFNLELKDKTYEEYLPPNYKWSWPGFFVFVAIILIILFIRASFYEPYKIPTGSMIPTLKIGDFLIVKKSEYDLRLPFIGHVKKIRDPKRGEIITFYPPISDDKMYVKRLIGLPGDNIQIKDTDLYINGKLISKTKVNFYPIMNDCYNSYYTPKLFSVYRENLLGVKHYILLKNTRDFVFQANINITIPPKHYFVMGDNRDNSEDSRIWGLLPRDRITGTVAIIWLSLNWNKLFSNIKEFVRWDRFFIIPH